jgi:hypothetical protein
LNWAGFCQPVNELDQTANHPALSPVLANLSGKKKRQIILADLAPPRGKSTFLMISPNLHDIWVVFFLNLSQELKLVLLLYFGTLGDGYSL